ncbi:8589_t:CDS:1, partial [Gigaspora margarita]
IAFSTLKKNFVSASILAYPNFSKEFILFTNASEVAISAILLKKMNKKE